MEAAAPLPLPASMAGCLQEGFPKNLGLNSTFPSPGERKTSRHAAKMLLSPAQALEKFPGESQRLLYPGPRLIPLLQTAPAHTEVELGVRLLSRDWGLTPLHG